VTLFRCLPAGALVDVPCNVVRELRRAGLVQVQLQHGGGTIGCVVHDKLDEAVVPRRNETIKRVVRDDHDGASVLRRRWRYVAGIIGRERELDSGYQKGSSSFGPAGLALNGTPCKCNWRSSTTSSTGS
jgi:hypothetical protein